MQANEIRIHNKISPEKVIRGNGAWIEGIKDISQICKSPILLGRSQSTDELRERLYQDLKAIGINPIKEKLNYDCCEEDLNRIYNIAINQNCDGIIAAGGGKVLDAGKLIADRLSLECITIPLSAATCAGWTALSNIYSKDGAFIKDQSLKSCPKLLIFDHQFVKHAPKRTLSSGIADAIAKWYEASLSSISSDDGLVQQAVQMSRVLRDQLFIDGVKALNNPDSAAWIRVAEGCALTAGLIGGIGGSQCRTAIAHPIHNGLTQINEATNQSLHGEIVGFGIIIQLQLEDLYLGNKLAKQAKKQLIEFLKQLNLPTTIESLGLDKVSAQEIKNACKFVCENESYINSLPLNIDKDLLHKILMSHTVNVSFSRLSDIKK
tara:strand:- start:15693 stop:16826 length:1134 start_codon:yes stop_codon:yes gene_type:complete